MPSSLDRFRELRAAGGTKFAIARTCARALDLAGQSISKFGTSIITSDDIEKRLPATVIQRLAVNAARAHQRRSSQVFVVASGPSSRHLTMARAADADIIVVNEMARPILDRGIRVSAIALHDGLYFNRTPAMNAMLSETITIARDAAAFLIVPAREATRLVEEFGVPDAMLLTFFETGQPLRLMPRPARPIDFGRPTPQFQTVSHAALAAAIFLGYSQIGLIGIDLTYVGFPTQPIVHDYGQNKYYPSINTDNAAVAYVRGHGWDWPRVLRDVAEQLEAYQWLVDAAAQGGAKLVNHAPGSLLATVPGLAQEIYS